MAEEHEGPSTGGNKLLAGLPASELHRLQSHLEPVSLGLKHIFYEPGQPIPFVHFITRGVASLLTILEEGVLVEVSTIGYEGMVGLPLFLGVQTTPGRAIMQVQGDGLRMSAEAFSREVKVGTVLHARLHLYTQALMIQMAQSLACNRLHSIEQRCSRWLLMTQDRAGSNGFALTQEFLAQMLGVRRAGVSEVASSFQKQGLITYQRGQISVLDRPGLEARACECYQVISDEYDRLLG